MNRLFVRPGELQKLGYPPVVAIRPIREFGLQGVGESLPPVDPADKRATLRLRRYAAEKRLALAPSAQPTKEKKPNGNRKV